LPRGKGTTSPEAHDRYLKGLYYLNRRGVGAAALEPSIEYFHQALAIDSEYAAAWAGLAQAYGFLAAFGDKVPGEVFPQAKAAALHAIALDSGLALAHASLGFIAIVHDWDWNTARRELDWALALDSTQSYTHLYRALYFEARGRLEDALAEMRTALQLDPLNQLYNARVASILSSLGRFADAEAAARQALQLDSTNAQARGELAAALSLQGRYAEAIATFPPDTADLQPINFGGPLGYTYGLAGRGAEARRIEERLRRHAQERYIDPMALAFVAMGQHDTASALDWLERGYHDRSFFAWTIGVWPYLESLHGTPRFERLIKAMGIVESHVTRR
jgi:tetratricopeptide (TPR) repeat protein